MIIDIKPELQDLINRISNRNMYSGNKIPDSIMRQFEIEEKEGSAGVLVPYWLPVLQRGRGPRRSKKDHGLWKRIYKWMRARNMFNSDTEAGRIREAKFITWYINKYGNKQFRSKTFVDIYNTERERTIDEIDRKYGLFIDKITKEAI